MRRKIDKFVSANCRGDRSPDLRPTRPPLKHHFFEWFSVYYDNGLSAEVSCSCIRELLPKPRPA
jgi:hypothetical protein